MCPVHAEENGPLTRVAEIRALSREETAKALPVRLDGVVIWQKPGGFVIWDGERSIWADYLMSEPGTLRMENCGEKDLLPGAHLEIEGSTVPGRYSPVVVLRNIRLIGKMALPKPATVPLAQLLSGSEATQFIELEGVVQSAERNDQGGITADMMVDGHLCRVRVIQKGSIDPAGLVDARIRVRGIFTPDTNFRSEAVGLNMMVDLADKDIEVITPPPPDPFSAPRVTLNELLPFSPDAQPYHRKVASGTVIFAVPGWFFFLLDGKTSVRVNSAARDVKVGRLVDVAGFVNTSHTFASLGNAQVRDRGPATLPVPVSTTVSMLLDPAAKSGLRKAESDDLSGQLVTIKGKLLRTEWKRDGVPAAVRIGADDRSFPAFFPVDQKLTEAQAKSWVPGADVELTGIAEYDFGLERGPLGEYPLVAFHLWLADPSAIHVLNLPSWWTPARQGIALAVTGGVIVLLLAWTWTLRHRVKTQTAIIRGQIEREAVQDERVRIARDMHDEVGARLSQIAILQDIFARDHPHAETAREDLLRLSTGMQEAVTALDEVVWTVNPQNDTLASMAEFIAHYASSYLEPAEIACRIQMPIEWPTLEVRSQTRHELVCAFKEALQNVIKHSQASEVAINMGIAGESFILDVSDNGCGFIPQESGHGCDGIHNMKSRLGRVGGTCEITNRVPAGTHVAISLPLHS
jgi:signal transduction histidine kinase